MKPPTLQALPAYCKAFVVSALIFSLVAILAPMPSQAASAKQINERVQTTLQDFRYEVRDAQQILGKAKGLLIFPRVYQAGFGIGGEYGEGALLMGGKTVDYYRLTSASFGFQLGGQRKAIVLAFMTDESLSNFRKGKGWNIGADASAAILVVGAEGGISAARLNKPILAFVIDQKGLMYNLSLEGSKITRINK